MPQMGTLADKVPNEKRRKLKLIEANRHIRILPRGLSSRENILLVTNKQLLQKHLK